MYSVRMISKDEVFRAYAHPDKNLFKTLATPWSKVYLPAECKGDPKLPWSIASCLPKKVQRELLSPIQVIVILNLITPISILNVSIF
jgi:hypothetical protein